MSRQARSCRPLRPLVGVPARPFFVRDVDPVVVDEDAGQSHARAFVAAGRGADDERLPGREDRRLDARGDQRCTVDGGLRVSTDPS